MNRYKCSKQLKVGQRVLRKNYKTTSLCRYKPGAVVGIYGGKFYVEFEHSRAIQKYSIENWKLFFECIH